MPKQENLQLFEDQPIRSAWNEEEEEWYFSIVDVVWALTDQPDARHASTYWAVLKKRLNEEGASELLTNCKQLKMKALSAVLALCLILSLSACSIGKKELKFRDVSFGTSYKEAIPLLEQSGLKNPGPSKEFSKDGTISVYFDDVEVAGYRMKPYLTFRMANKGNKDINSAIFMEANYRMYADNADIHEINSDLTSKLNDIYGKYSNTNTDSVYYDADSVNYDTAIIYSIFTYWNKFTDDAIIKLEVSKRNSSVTANITYTSGKEENNLFEIWQENTITPTPNKDGL